MFRTGFRTGPSCRWAWLCCPVSHLESETGSEPVLELDPVAAGLGHPLVRTGEVTPRIITNAAAAAGCHPTFIPGWLLPCEKYQIGRQGEKFPHPEHWSTLIKGIMSPVGTVSNFRTFKIKIFISRHYPSDAPIIDIR